jgi:hypothetical protein
MKVTINNGWVVTVMDGGIPLRKTFFAQKEDDGMLMLCTMGGDVQVLFEDGVDGWTMGSVAHTVDQLHEPLPHPVVVKAKPLLNNQ